MLGGDPQRVLNGFNAQCGGVEPPNAKRSALKLFNDHLGVDYSAYNMVFYQR